MGFTDPIIEDRFEDKTKGSSKDAIVCVDNRKRSGLGGSKHSTKNSVNEGGFLRKAEEEGIVEIVGLGRGVGRSGIGRYVVDEFGSDLDQGSVGGVRDAIRARGRLVGELDGIGDSFETDNPSGAVRRGELVPNVVQPFREFAEVGGFGAKDLPPVFVKNFGHVSRRGDSGVRVRVEHRSKGRRGPREKFAEASGKLLLSVVVNSSRAALFLAVEVLHLLEGTVGGQFDSLVLDKVEVTKQSGDRVKVGNVSDGREGVRE